MSIQQFCSLSAIIFSDETFILFNVFVKLDSSDRDNINNVNNNDNINIGHCSNIYNEKKKKRKKKIMMMKKKRKRRGRKKRGWL